jgi:hypothetical protein
MCKQWDESFERFYADMGPRPSPAHSLDRIDNDGDYEPDNCRWSSRSEQCRNRSSTKMLIMGGKSQSLAAWCQETGLTHATVLKRLTRGWTVERALAK